MKNRILAMLMVCLMVVTLFTGCTGKGEEKSVDKSKDTVQEGSKKETPKENEEKAEELYKFKMFFLVYNPDMSEPTQKLFDRWEKECNVEIELETPPAANYKERLQIMMAGGDYPEVVNFSSHTDTIFRNAVDNDVIIPITEYVKDAPHLQKYTYPISWDSVKVKEGNDDIYI